MLDDGFSAEVANSCGLLLPFVKRICHWNNRGACRYPVSFSSASIHATYLITNIDMSTTRMPRRSFSEALSSHVLIRLQGTTSLSSATGKTRPRLLRISQWSLRSTTSRSTRFTEHFPLAVRKNFAKVYSSVLTGPKVRMAPLTFGTKMHALG